MKHAYREDYMGDTALIPEIRHVGRWSTSSAPGWGLEPHRHPDAYEICYIDSGTVDWWAPEGVYEVGPGMAYLTRPGEVHGAVNAACHPSEIYWVQIKLHGSGRVRGLDESVLEAIAAGLDGDGPRSFPAAGGALKAAMDEMLTELRAPGPFASTLVRSALHRVLVSAVRGRSASHASTPSDALVARAQEWMLSRLDTPMTVEEVAVGVGVSPSYLYERFGKTVRMSPDAWWTRARLRRAKELLRDPGISITEIAFDVGFASSQYFATAFKRHVGVTPREYRRSCAGDGVRPEDVRVF